MSDNNGNAIVDVTHIRRRYCKYCGSEIPIDAAFCSSCGKPQTSMPQQNEVQSVPQRPVQQAVYISNPHQEPTHAPASNASTTVIVNGNNSNGMGVAGFIFSILALLGCWIPGANMVIWFLGALFSFIGLFKAPRGMAITGFIISFIDIIILISFFGALIGLIGAIAS